MEYVLRFLVGGAVVSLFAMLGDVLRPKSFAGLFGAAPSVAIVSLALATYGHGPEYVSVQATTMLAGATALLGFSVAMCHLIKRCDLSAIVATSLSFPVWLLIAFGLYVAVI